MGREGPHDAGARTLARRVEHDDVGTARRRTPRASGVTSASRDAAGGGTRRRCGAASAQARGVPLDGEDRSRRAHRVGQGDGEEPGAGVEVEHRPHARAVAGQGEHRGEQCRRGAGVDLPEDPRRDPVGAPVDDGVHGAGRRRHLAPDDEAGADVGEARRGPTPGRDRDHRLARFVPVAISSSRGAGPPEAERTGGGDRALATGHSSTISSSVGAVPPEPDRAGPSTARRTRLRQPSPSVSPGTGSTSTARSTPASRCQLLGDAERLEPALRAASSTCWKSQPAAPAGSGVRARGIDPVGGGSQDLDGVGPQVGGRAGGHAGPDPLAGEGVPDEDDLAVGSPRHAATAGGDGPDLELQQARVVRGGRRHGPERRAATSAKISGHGVSIRPCPIVVGAKPTPNEEEHRCDTC